MKTVEAGAFRMGARDVPMVDSGFPTVQNALNLEGHGFCKVLEGYGFWKVVKGHGF
jgi:hypothetical protein